MHAASTHHWPFMMLLRRLGASLGLRVYGHISNPSKTAINHNSYVTKVRYLYSNHYVMPNHIKIVSRNFSVSPNILSKKQKCSAGEGTSTSKVKENTKRTSKGTKKTLASQLEKLLRDKQMLNRKRTLGFISYKHKNRLKGMPQFVLDQFKDNLEKLVQNSDEKWDNEEEADGVITSPSGRSLWFPLKNMDLLDVKDFEKTDQNSTSVSTIMMQSMAFEKVASLFKWEKKMIKELGQDGFQRMKQEMFQEGHITHANFQTYLEGKPAEDLTLTPDVAGYWASAGGVLGRLGTAAHHEINIKHPFLGYHGRVDCIGTFDGKASILEWKTSRTLKSLKYCEDYLIQAVAYLGAVNFDPDLDVQVDQVVVVVTYKDGKEATVIVLDQEGCENYWKKWLRRILEFRDLEAMRREFVLGKIHEWKKKKTAS